MLILNLILISQEAPAIVESHYDVRIVGCSGGIGGKKLKSSKAPLCSESSVCWASYTLIMVYIMGILLSSFLHQNLLGIIVWVHVVSNPHNVAFEYKVDHTNCSISLIRDSTDFWWKQRMNMM